MSSNFIRLIRPRLCKLGPAVGAAALTEAGVATEAVARIAAMPVEVVPCITGARPSEAERLFEGAPL
ncbi:MAG TPA: hypothetical protein VGJ26_20540 [Pirellulales bacterium]